MIRTLFLIFVCTPALAEVTVDTSKPPAPVAPAPVNNTGKRLIKKVPAFREDSFWGMTVTASQSQESVKAERAGNTTSIQMQMLGAHVALNYNRYWSPRYKYHHSLDLSCGSAKGKANHPTITDEVRDQFWMAATLSWGVAWKTSPVSELGFGIPLTYRQINWGLEQASGLTLDKKSSFSAGFSGSFLTSLNKNFSLLISGTHQILWNSMMWEGGFQFNF